MGFGDVMLAVLIGAYFGAFYNDFADLLLVNWFSWCFAALIILILRSKGKLNGRRIAFAPYLFFGVFTLMIVNQPSVWQLMPAN